MSPSKRYLLLGSLQTTSASMIPGYAGLPPLSRKWTPTGPASCSTGLVFDSCTELRRASRGLFKEAGQSKRPVVAWKKSERRQRTSCVRFFRLVRYQYFFYHTQYKGFQLRQAV